MTPFEPQELFPVALQARGRSIAFWTKSVARSANRVVFPISALFTGSNSGGTRRQRRRDLVLAVTCDAEAHRHHRIHAGEVDVTAYLPRHDVAAMGRIEARKGHPRHELKRGNTRLGLGHFRQLRQLTRKNSGVCECLRAMTSLCKNQPHFWIPTRTLLSPAAGACANGATRPPAGGQLVSIVWTGAERRQPTQANC